jgi:two-component system, sensor histidine kinase PdtaS
VPTLTQLASRVCLRDADLEWLHALISDWLLLADLSFADLVLWAPLGEAHDGDVSWLEGASWIALAQMRPTTAPTALADDIVGTVRPSHDQPLLAAAFLERRVCREGDPRGTGPARDHPGQS